ncbi:MAG: protein-export membrane protein SecD [Candidatus Woykebacteria bacterium GWB1_45_5]|uniref:Protein translocase subunit SecD n=2 Tax=Candidatus Woykeibacteriota TaxID=1817899 RepID=A0A1G1W2E2_9BACT|nr:MAG: protein-export membrane protein SecD [Candidatus Woykebacteria bacterium GWA1_44_8]OGY22655.1 MAG: protein-export membrane protein SecD [Candidatus Woykebacteria bacterium GWB1_45_5]
MLKNPRIVLLAIIVLTILALVVDWPRVPVKFALGPFKVDTVLAGPQLNLKLFGVSLRRDMDVKLGLDLKGGTSLTLRADVSDIDEADRGKALDAAKEVISRRVNFLGVTEPIVQTSKVGGDYRIIVELPGVSNVEEAKRLVGQTAKLEFREFTDSEVPPGTIPMLENTKPTGISGKDLKSANPDFQQTSGTGEKGGPVVRFTLRGDSANKFREATKRLIGKPLVIFLDDVAISAPTVQSEIGEEGVITGLTAEESKRLAIQLSAGALPVKKIDIISEKTIGPTLGKTSIDRSIVAGAVGIFIIALFMLAYYGLPGLLADAALLLYTLYVLALFKIIPITLTLAGIAGFILSIGMAVDANILIFERMREELRAGRNRAQSIEIGFTRAWSSIRDSNVSSLITCTILFWFGTGPVRGFALALAIGILVSMLTAITVTRTFLRLVYRT